MSNRIEEAVQAQPNPITEPAAPTEASSNASELSLAYILEQIARIQSDTSYLMETIQMLAQIPFGDSGESGSPGDIQGQAKAQALGDVVRCRETTNQQLLRFYEKLYDDWRADNHPSKDTKVLFELRQLSKTLQETGAPLPMIQSASDLFERICKGQVQV